MADTLDLLTLAEGHAAINLANTVTTQDTKLAQYITAVSRRMDELCGPIVVRTITAETHDGDDDTPYADGEVFTRNGYPIGGGRSLGRGLIYLRQRPVSSVTTVTEYAYTTATVLTADSTSTLAGAGYTFNPRTGALYRRSGGRDWYFPSGRNNIAVTYVAGRAANTAAVDPKFKLAASVILNHVWRPQSGAWAQTANPYEDVPETPLALTPGFAIPNAALEWIADEIHQDRYLVVGNS